MEKKLRIANGRQSFILSSNKNCPYQHINFQIKALYSNRQLLHDFHPPTLRIIKGCKSSNYLLLYQNKIFMFKICDIYIT